MKTKNVDDAFPRVLENENTGRWHIQYQTVKGEYMISSLSWNTRESAQKVIDSVLKTHHTNEIL